MKRLRIVQEIVASEKSYVHALQALITVADIDFLYLLNYGSLD